MVKLGITFRPSGLGVCFLASILVHVLVESKSWQRPNLESLKPHTLWSWLSMHLTCLELYYIFPSSGLISGGTGPPLNILTSFWDATSFQANVTEMQLVLEPLWARPGSQVHMSICQVLVVADVGRSDSKPWRLAGSCQWRCAVLAERYFQRSNTASHRVPQRHSVLKQTPWERFPEWFPHGQTGLQLARVAASVTWEIKIRGVKNSLLLSLLKGVVRGPLLSHWFN